MPMQMNENKIKYLIIPFLLLNLQLQYGDIMVYAT